MLPTPVTVDIVTSPFPPDPPPIRVRTWVAVYPAPAVWILAVSISSDPPILSTWIVDPAPEPALTVVLYILPAT